jgi:Integrase core domain
VAGTGPEFKGAFDEACRALGLRHTRTKPRHAWTNGFVGRLQGTILQEHWRGAFRRRYVTGRAVLQRSLADFMRYYNTTSDRIKASLRGRRVLGAESYFCHSTRFIMLAACMGMS